MAGRRVTRRRVVRVDGHGRRARVDSLAGEEPLEVRVNGEPVAVTMRTPGDDFELALGFCFTEGIVADPAAVRTVRYCTPGPGPYDGTFNVVEVDVPGATVPDELRRRVFTTSSCGVCGTASIAAVRKDAAPVHDDPLRLDPDVVAALPERLRAEQAVFDRTGGLHAAALFTAGGELRVLREDVGRHNAVDKVVGWAAAARALPLREQILFVSGRIAFEIAQKALRAGIPAVAAVSAPSALAVELAEEAGMTMLGFVRGSAMNVYAGAERLLP